MATNGLYGDGASGPSQTLHATRGDNQRMIDLNDLRAFEKVAGTKSFASAARALGLPRSSVSRSIARLEREIDARLFQRTTRQVALTPTGEALLLRCAGLLSALEEAVAQVRTSTSVPRGPLRVNAFAANLLDLNQAIAEPSIRPWAEAHFVGERRLPGIRLRGLVVGFS